MANALYDKGREAFLAGDLDWDGNTIKAVLIDTDAYTVDLATDQFLDDVPAGARKGTPQTLGTKTVAAGVADAADITFTAVADFGGYVEALLIYQDTGDEGTSRLIAYIDEATGLPVYPNGGDISVAWSNDDSKIFKL